MTHSVSVCLTRFGFSSLKFLIVAILALTALQTNWNVCAQDQDKVVAVVNGSKITQRQVDASVTAQVFPLQQQIYALRIAALEGLILRTILEDEAKKRNFSVEELSKQLTAGTVDVSEVEVERLYAENASAMGAMSPEEGKERLRLDLESQARMKNYRTALLRLRSSSNVELNLEEPKLPTSENDRSPSIGPVAAMVIITTFADFQCPYCRGSQELLKRIREAYPTDVRLIFKNLPLEMHAEAASAARAAFCAGQQGFFWKYHDALYAADDLSPEGLKKIGLDQGLNLPRFDACMVSEISQAAVRRDITEAKRLGIDSTPTFIINGKLVRGAIGFEEFKVIVARELKLAQRPSTVSSR
ncbi:MAG: oxidoreductase [Acidobacteria bacterium]|nr:oxidoreductase [Acidobacteriota bacterium]